MLFQSLGSVLVGFECLCRLTPDVYVDTIGAAFTYPLVKLLTSARVVAYVHYPIISRVSLVIFYIMLCCVEFISMICLSQL